MSEEDQSDYRLIVSFPDESSSFVNGYEAGAIGYRMEHTAEQVIEETVHTENCEVFQRMCAGFGWEVEFSPTNPPMYEWRIAHFRRLPQRKHLAVVK